MEDFRATGLLKVNIKRPTKHRCILCGIGIL